MSGVIDVEPLEIAKDPVSHAWTLQRGALAGDVSTTDAATGLASVRRGTSTCCST
jgi:hypothetical protein